MRRVWVIAICLAFMNVGCEVPLTSVDTTDSTSAIDSQAGVNSGGGNGRGNGYGRGRGGPKDEPDPGTEPVPEPQPEPLPEPGPEPLPEPEPIPPPDPTPTAGIWISRDEIMQQPMSGSSWTRLKSVADQDAGIPNLSDQEQYNNVAVMAKALVYVRTGEARYRTEVRSQCMLAIGTEAGGRTLAFGRELAAYVIAADLVGLEPDEDLAFRAWLRNALGEVLDGRTLVSTHEERPNNWGTHAGGSRAAVAAYLGDQQELARVAQVFKGWLGDWNAYHGFSYGDLSWQADPGHPVGINPTGTTRDGHSIDGVLPDDQRRSGGFIWPPPLENYVYEALQGALLQAVILHRAGYDVWNWQDRALLRAYQWLYTQANFAATGDDTWQMPLVDYYYGTHYWDGGVTSPGKNVGWTDWTHRR